MCSEFVEPNKLHILYMLKDVIKAIKETDANEGDEDAEVLANALSLNNGDKDAEVLAITLSLSLNNGDENDSHAGGGAGSSCASHVGPSSNDKATSTDEALAIALSLSLNNGDENDSFAGGGAGSSCASSGKSSQVYSI